PTRHRRCAAPSAARSPRDSGIAEAAPSRPSSASHAILAAAAAGLLMAAGADGAARQQQGIRFDIRAGRAQNFPLKDFSSEIRANMDIQRFLKEATLLLDVEGANVECIIEQMLRSIFRADHESHHSSGSGGGGGDGGSVAGAAGAIDSRLDAKVQDAKKTCFCRLTGWTTPRLAKTIKSISVVDSEGLITDNSWLCTMCSLNGVQKRHVAIARLSTPVNLGRSSEGVSFILLVVTPTKEKGTKSDIELGRTFATILADSEFRQKLLLAETESEFKEMLQGHAHELGEEQKIYRRKSLRTKDFMSQAFNYLAHLQWHPSDLKRRLSHYLLSDFIDAFRDNKTIRKVVTTVIFLYFACLMPCIAFGVLNNSLTNGYISESFGLFAFQFVRTLFLSLS
uniref:HCO3_cotransp domain-containing protein n=1 Tax=Macrostomum lignano TaxID=282301 RepID=A0A1I8FHH5_9PLAT